MLGRLLFFVAACGALMGATLALLMLSRVVAFLFFGGRSRARF